MALVLRQSTAVDVLIGPFLDLTDGATAEELETPAVFLSKNGQALGAKSDVTVPIHDDAGYYNCELDATDTNTVGTLVLVVEKSATALPVRHEFQVVEEEVYDDLYAASAVGYLKPATAGRDLDVTATGAAGVDWGNIENPTTSVGLSGTTIKEVTDVETKLGTPAGVSIAADIAAVEAQTAEIGAAGAGLTNINLPDQTMNITGNLSGSVGSVTGAVGNVTGAVGSVTGLTPATVHADLDDIQARLPAALVGGRMDSDIGAKTGNVALSAQEKLDVNAEMDTALNTAIPGSPTADSVNERVKAVDDKLPSSSYLKGSADADGGMDTADKADVQAESQDALVAYDLDHLIEVTAGVEKPTDGSYLDQIINKNASQTFDSTTDSLEAIRDNQPGSAATIADAVLDEALSGHTTAGTLGRKVGDIPLVQFKKGS